MMTSGEGTGGCRWMEPEPCYAGPRYLGMQRGLQARQDARSRSFPSRLPVLYDVGMVCKMAFHAEDEGTNTLCGLSKGDGPCFLRSVPSPDSGLRHGGVVSVKLKGPPDLFKPSACRFVMPLRYEYHHQWLSTPVLWEHVPRGSRKKADRTDSHETRGQRGND